MSKTTNPNLANLKLAEVLLLLTIKIKTMTQKEFEKLSEDEVRSLNGYDSLDYVTEAWRGGYVYFKEKIRKLLETEYNSEFLDEVEKLINDEINEFSEQWDD